MIRGGVLRHAEAAIALLVVLAACGECQSLSVPNPAGAAGAENGGNADVAFQGYYLGGDSLGLTSLTGTDISFRDYYPGLGMISGNFEGYVANTQGKPGDNFLGLKGLLWKGRRWNFTGGDFSVSANPVTFPFQNYFLPLIGVRGAQAEMSDGTSTYSVFGGEETLAAGERVSYRITVPQDVFGASVKQTIGSLELSARYLHLGSSDDADVQFPQYFGANRDFQRADTLTVAAYEPLTKRLRLYSDATWSRTEAFPGTAAVRSVPLSWLSGVVWQGSKLTVRANYGSQSTSYVPVLGYYAGDRKGPYAEIRYKISKRIDAFGSASTSQNNLEGNVNVATLTATNFSGGASATLGHGYSISGQYSAYFIDTLDPTVTGLQKSTNSQSSVALTKSLKRHSLSLTARDLDVGFPGYVEKQRVAEVGDNVQFGRFSAGGAVRFQQTNAGQVSNTVFFRGNVQASFGRVTVYAQAEFGNDLLNKNVFAVDSVNTTVAGISVQRMHGWNLQAEVFRDSLISSLNTENIFLFETQGEAVSTILTDLNQWNVYFRLSKRFTWGAPMPGQSNGFTSDAMALFGSVQGFVRDAGPGGAGVAGVPVALDASRSTTTDVSGSFSFSDVPEGPHRVEISPTDLPAELNFGPSRSVSVDVRARKISRADLNVARLVGEIEGRVAAPLGKEVPALDAVVVTLMPGNRQTTCDADGSFAFYNLAAGEYRVSVDATTLPQNYVLTSPRETGASIANDAPVLLNFSIEKHEPVLPVRSVYLGEAEPIR